jgi:hypothetical protein
MKHMSRTVVFTLLAAVVCAPGCFKYQLVEAGTVRPQEEVRVLLTDDAALRLASHYGAIARRLDGQLTPAGTDSMLLAVWIGRNYVGTSFENARQNLSLGRREVMEVRRRQLSVSRTAIVSASVLGMLGVVINRIGFLGNPNPPVGQPRGDAPDPDSNIVLFGRIR